MSITDELRDCIRTANRSYEDARNPYNDREILHIPEEELLVIADRIDERHEQMQYDYQHEFDGWKFIRNTQWVELPKDADGNTINIGDIVALRDEFEVRGLVLIDKDLWVVEDRFGKSFNPDKLHHVKPDTWEDIIEDAVKNGMYDHDNERIQQKLVERCRRLAGEE